MAAKFSSDSPSFAPRLNLIGGEWRKASTGKTFDDINPVRSAGFQPAGSLGLTGPAGSQRSIGRFPLSTEADVDAAVRAASEAFKTWRKVPAPQRGAILRRCADALAAEKEELARLMAREMGKTLIEARGDVQEAIDCANLYAGFSRTFGGQTLPSELPDKFAMSVRKPLGVCGQITPWNFPIAIPSWKAFPALLCGNTVILKPAEDSPACASAFGRVLMSAGVPAGVFNVVHGEGEVAGAALVNHPGVAAISFTGSSETGKIIAENCGRQLKRCSLELGGKNAQIVMDDADLNLALEGAVWGAFATAGQRCTATSRLILHEKIYDRFLRRFIDAAKALRLGDPLDAKTQIGPLVNAAQLERVENYIRIGIEEGATLRLGGRRARGRGLNAGHFFEPTIFTDVTPSMRIAREEIFGPVCAVMSFKRVDEAVSILNGTRYGLSSSIYTRDVNAAFRAMRELEAGITYINGPTIGAEVHLPFGGVKETGNGHREAGAAVLDFYSEWQSVYVDYSGKLQRAQIDT
ncbi:MAG TPA: aldehyde dehydrogenase family protein [Planctomycetota bacterium]|nr:aldehyde dehydrogenase family protein [Planctomycetota bacterium]